MCPTHRVQQKSFEFRKQPRKIKVVEAGKPTVGALQWLSMNIAMGKLDLEETETWLKAFDAVENGALCLDWEGERF